MKEVTPDAAETTSYFQLPGYYYPGYDYNGMFVWFGLQKSYIRILLRPPTIQNRQKELTGYTTTKVAVHIPLAEMCHTLGEEAGKSESEDNEG